MNTPINHRIQPKVEEFGEEKEERKKNLGRKGRDEEGNEKKGRKEKEDDNN